MPPLADAPNATTLDQSDKSATLELYRAALGPLNTDYYLQVFASFDAAGRAGPRWNWAAGLCTLNWMVLRQLWGAALAYTGGLVALVLLAVGLGQLVLKLSMPGQVGLLAVVAAIAVGVPGLYGNALVYRHCFRKIGLALERHSRLEDACDMLRREGTARRRLLSLVVGNLVLVGAMLAIYLALPHNAGTGAGTDAEPSMVEPTSSGNASAGPVRDTTVPPRTTALPETTVPPNTTSLPDTTAPPISGAAQPVPEPPISPLTASPSAKPSPALTTSPLQSGAPAETAQQRTVAPETRYVVNVGLFADEKNARRAADVLRQAKQPVLRDRVRSSKGLLNRVRVGPFNSQAEADTAAQTIRSLDLDAVVVPQVLP
jgi:cell division septation protein DedD